MIKPVGQFMNAAVEAARLRETASSRSASRVVAENDAESPAPASTPASRMAGQGAPIDSARIASIKQAIASGNYPVDPGKIAEKMLDLDLPLRQH
ncbi:MULTISPECIES: flagellar biosynthesis anti-sigma factor FlgM [Sphingobium]|uniref:Negative regulator of flagellin synthesis n=1 Tax=Sphingobium lignivorans TaxID=2735886 RepID=A0ABR6NDE8_9SPHN|nr:MULTISPECIES: flagellar biosynthesis anti-sigma factor FlgM [Sphingobium]MBB5985275.1 negative regulator of flagellin synthesis FlgM [Sphingobium lignivorans]BAK65980.1 putative negative regulator of flagellin synthesis [Sphingobium sp. SYK-6]